MIKLRALHARLALALLALLLATGVVNIVSTSLTTQLYRREATQQAHLGLADNIARMKQDRLVGESGEIRREGLDELFHWMMVVNPAVDFYVLDLDGHVVGFDPSSGDLARDRIDLEPIRRLLTEPGRLPVEGEDPRSADETAIFSVSPIPVSGKPSGYLYIVFDDEPFGSLTEGLRRSYILRWSSWAGLAYLTLALVAGFLLFRTFTRPLRHLSERMSGFLHREDEVASPLEEDPRTEFEILEESFEEMTRRIERQMEEIEAMASSRGELISNVSHDLRTPIALLQGYLETLNLKEGALSREERAEYLKIAHRQSERLGTLVNELFELTKLESYDFEPRLERFKLAELVQDNVQRFQLQAKEKGVVLEAEFDPDVPPVFVDVGLMERALENLIENALRFTPPGGAVRVALREDGNRLSIAVIDTGCGIPEDDLKKIFDRFYRSQQEGVERSRTGGSGLGLAITRRIAEVHGSDLEVESRPGHGSTFTFSLQAAPRTRQLILDQIRPPSVVS